MDPPESGGRFKVEFKQMLRRLGSAINTGRSGLFGKRVAAQSVGHGTVSDERRIPANAWESCRPQKRSGSAGNNLRAGPWCGAYCFGAPSLNSYLLSASTLPSQAAAMLRLALLQAMLAWVKMSFGSPLPLQ